MATHENAFQISQRVVWYNAAAKLPAAGNAVQPSARAATNYQRPIIYINPSSTYTGCHRLADRDESDVRAAVETSPLGDPEFHAVQASVAGHHGSRAVLELNLRGVLEGVVDELGTVSRAELNALWAARDGVPDDDIVFCPPGFYHPRRIRPLVCVNIVPESVGREYEGVGVAR